MNVAILGAGPAGMSCALWLKNLGCQPLVLERDTMAGGLLRQNVLANDWVLGQRGRSGTEMAAEFATHFSESAIPCRFGAHLRQIDPAAQGFELTLRDGSEYSAAAIVIATGTRVGGQEWIASLPGAAAIPAERLLLGPAAFGHADRFQGKHVLVAGGGDNAHEFIRFTAPFAARQTLVTRAGRRAQSVQQEAVEALATHGHVEILEHTGIAGLAWEQGKIVASLRGKRHVWQGDFLVVQHGYAPNSEAVLAALSPKLRPQIATDAEGYLLADTHGQTACPGIYAIGDIANRDTPCVVTALAAGATAARAIERSFRKPS